MLGRKEETEGQKQRMLFYTLHKIINRKLKINSIVQYISSSAV